MTSSPPAARRVVVSGASGLIGSALSTYLRSRGDEVVHLVRRPARASAEVEWDPAAHRLDPSALSGADAVVHLAGAGVGDRRWTPAYKRVILASRVDGTQTVAAALARLGEPIALVSGSAIGYYGDRGEEILTEGSEGGTGFLADVVRAWEGSTVQARDAGLRVGYARTGLVMTPGAGAFAPLLRLTRLGLGGSMGSGRQYWSWVTLVDEVRALAYLVDSPDLEGPVNLVAPDPRPQLEVVRAIAAALHRPALLPAPGLALRAVLGELADDVLASARVRPTRLAGSGFVFEHPTLRDAAGWLVGRS